MLPGVFALPEPATYAAAYSSDSSLGSAPQIASAATSKSLRPRSVETFASRHCASVWRSSSVARLAFHGAVAPTSLASASILNQSKMPFCV